MKAVSSPVIGKSYLHSVINPSKPILDVRGAKLQWVKLVMIDKVMKAKHGYDAIVEHAGDRYMSNSSELLS